MRILCLSRRGARHDSEVCYGCGFVVYPKEASIFSIQHCISRNLAAAEMLL